MELEEPEPSAAPELPPPAELPEEPPEPVEDGEPLYPPLPALEPDPDSDIPVEDQQFFLDLHAQVYEASQRSFSTGVVDPAARSLLSGEALRELEAGVEAWASRGLIQLSPDSEVVWLEVVDERDGTFSVVECTIVGPRTGLYDEASGEAVELFGETAAGLIRTNYGLVDTGDGPEYRGGTIEAFSDSERCDAR